MAGRWIVTWISLLSVGVLSGCGSSSATKVGNSYTTARPAVITTPKSLGLRERITIVNAGGKYAYSPRVVTVAAGTIVTWKNKSSAPHTITFIGRTLPSAGIKPGGTAAATFTRGGTFAYHCTIHPYMKGVIIVNTR